MLTKKIIYLLIDRTGDKPYSIDTIANLYPTFANTVTNSKQNIELRVAFFCDYDHYEIRRNNSKKFKPDLIHPQIDEYIYCSSKSTNLTPIQFIKTFNVEGDGGDGPEAFKTAIYKIHYEWTLYDDPNTELVIQVMGNDRGHLLGGKSNNDKDEEKFFNSIKIPFDTRHLLDHLKTIRPNFTINYISTGNYTLWASFVVGYTGGIAYRTNADINNVFNLLLFNIFGLGYSPTLINICIFIDDFKYTDYVTDTKYLQYNMNFYQLPLVQANDCQNLLQSFDTFLFELNISNKKSKYNQNILTNTMDKLTILLRQYGPRYLDNLYLLSKYNNNIRISNIIGDLLNIAKTTDIDDNTDFLIINNIENFITNSQTITYDSSNICVIDLLANYIRDNATIQRNNNDDNATNNNNDNNDNNNNDTANEESKASIKIPCSESYKPFDIILNLFNKHSNLNSKVLNSYYNDNYCIFLIVLKLELELELSIDNIDILKLVNKEIDAFTKTDTNSRMFAYYNVMLSFYNATYSNTKNYIKLIITASSNNYVLPFTIPGTSENIMDTLTTNMIKVLDNPKITFKSDNVTFHNTLKQFLRRYPTCMAVALNLQMMDLLPIDKISVNKISANKMTASKTKINLLESDEYLTKMKLDEPNAVIKRLQHLYSLYSKINYESNKKLCNICQNYYTEHNFYNCANCNYQCCYTCTLKIITNGYTKGKIILERNFNCVQCSNQYTILGTAIHEFLTSAYEPKHYYIVCTSCNNATQFTSKNCVNDIETNILDINLSNFLCENCELVPLWHMIDNGTIFKVTKECPSCHKIYQKISGCNHMQCKNKSCNQHWCFACCKPYTSGGSKDCKCPDY